MVGRVIAAVLHYLLAMPLIFYTFCPGRDTQVQAVSHYGLFVPKVIYDYGSCFSVFTSKVTSMTAVYGFCSSIAVFNNDLSYDDTLERAMLIPSLLTITMILFNGTTWLIEHILTFYSAVIETFCVWKWSSSSTIRKHGRWKNNRAFPRTWMMLSYLALSSPQVQGFVHKNLHRFTSGSPQSISTYDGFKYGIDTTVGSTPKRPRFLFYDVPKPIEDPFAPIEPDNSELMRAAVNPFELCDAKYLGIQGSLISDIWMEYMGQQAATFATATLDGDNDFDVTKICVFKSDTMVRIRSLQEEASDELVEALLQLPREQVSLCTAASPNHMVDMSHLLRTAKKRKSSSPDESLDATDVFPLLLDTGCSVACSGFKEDFHGQLAFGDFGNLNTADGQAKIEGFGMLRYDVISDKGNRRTILVPGYYAPTVQMRLISPQDYANYHHLPVDEYQYAGNAQWMFMCLKTDSDNPTDQELAFANIDPGSRLPFLHAERSHYETVNGKEARCHCHVTSIYDVKNVNLTSAQRNLKLDHDRLGHVSMQAVQRLYQPSEADLPDFDGVSTSKEPCLIAKEPAQLRCELPRCEACQCAKARKRPSGATHTKTKPETTETIRAGDLQPGDCVSIDQYESSVRGRRMETRGKERTSHQYCGGTLFYDHASGRIFNQHQVSLSAAETIESFRALEREASTCGVEIKKVHTDNGIFTSKAFRESLGDDHQLSLSAVGAHHQNGAAEVNIGKVQRMARAMMLHLRIHWPDEFSADLWPFAFDYAVYIYNHFPPKGKSGAPTPMELFCGTKMSCRHLRRLRVFGCPVYVLDPRLQDGKKIPKWEPRARKGQFLGFSKEHATNVGLVRNCRTGYISPQFHVVYDETFDTVAADGTIDLSEAWIDLFLNSREVYLDGFDPAVDGELPVLDEDWKSENELDRPKTEEFVNQDELVPQSSQRGGPSTPRQPSTPANPSGPVDPDPPDQDELGNESGVLPDDVPPSPLIPRQLSIDPPIPQGPHDVEVRELPQPTQLQPQSPKRRTRKKPEVLTYDQLGHRGQLSTKFVNSSFSLLIKRVVSRTILAIPVTANPNVIAFANLDWDRNVKDPYLQRFDAMFATQIDPETLQLYDADEAFHPFSFAAKVQSEDFPSYQEILRMDKVERVLWLKAMDAEISELSDREAVELVPRSEPKQLNEEIVKSTWAFRKKRKPDGSVSRYKARLCVRGDLQQGQFSTNETFAPVVEWSTIRMLFSLGILRDWKTASIDFKNAFTQGMLPKPVYLELPPGFVKGNPTLSDMVMKVKTSLYGDRRAANVWYRAIRKGLEDLKFVVSEFDPCLFQRGDCLICLYVDDAIIHAQDDATIAKVLREIADAGFHFNEDETFSSYLGIQVDHLPDGSKLLSQPGLTSQLLEMMAMTDCNPVFTPIASSLRNYPNSEDHDGSYNYRSALGMLMYLGNNTRPECAYAINACAQYSISPKKPHADAVRRICRYLKGTANKGIIIKPDDDSFTLDCHCDADFAGNWNLEDSEDPHAAKSRAGYLITLGKVPVLWKSKRITEICLSTMESEYIALSMSMRSLIHLRGLLFETNSRFDLGFGDSLSTISTVFEDNRAAQILATTDPPRMTPRSKHLAVKYHWFRSHLSDSTIVIRSVPSAENKADIFTKALPRDLFERHRKAICGW